MTLQNSHRTVQLKNSVCACQKFSFLFAITSIICNRITRPYWHSSGPMRTSESPRSRKSRKLGSCESRGSSTRLRTDVTATELYAILERVVVGEPYQAGGQCGCTGYAVRCTLCGCMGRRTPSEACTEMAPYAGKFSLFTWWILWFDDDKSRRVPTWLSR